MWKRIGYVVLFSLLCVLGWAGYIFYGQYQDHLDTQRWKASLAESVSPTVRIIRDSFPVPYRNATKTLHLYVPPNYATDTAARFPVIYMLDGESSFNDMENDSPEWQIDEVIDRSVAAGGPGAIVIGVNQAEARDQEYTPWPIEDYPDAHGDRFGEWLANTLKPWVDSTYRTRPEAAGTTIGGISRSGMMAYYLTLAHPDVFGNAIIQSPSMWVDEAALLKMPVGNPADKRIFISVGEKEGGMVGLAERARDYLLAQGVPPDRLRYHELEGMRHWHPTWRKSFALAYPWIVGG